MVKVQSRTAISKRTLEMQDLASIMIFLTKYLNTDDKLMKRLYIVSYHGNDIQ